VRNHFDLARFGSTTQSAYSRSSDG